MAYFIDDYKAGQKEVEGKWVVARTVKGPFLWRIKDAWLVLIGKCDAVRFHGQ